MIIFDNYEEDIKSNDVSVFFVFPKLLKISLAKLNDAKNVLQPCIELFSL